MNKIIVLLCGILVLSNAKAIATPRPQPTNIKSFTEWCEQKSTLPEATKHTVEVLLKRAGTQDCQQANRKLSNLTELYLPITQISDLKPLSSLTNLTELHLWGNQISDLKPLSNLTNLTELNLAGNQISEVKPLSSLTNLTTLDIWENK
ncbi:MAG: leucine-rich repeat domain-containing protein, partial [Cyanobacteria bacterium J06643_5]